MTFKGLIKRVNDFFTDKLINEEEILIAVSRAVMKQVGLIALMAPTEERLQEIAENFDEVMAKDFSYGGLSLSSKSNSIGVKKNKDDLLFFQSILQYQVNCCSNPKEASVRLLSGINSFEDQKRELLTSANDKSGSPAQIKTVSEINKKLSTIHLWSAIASILSEMESSSSNQNHKTDRDVFIEQQKSLNLASTQKENKALADYWSAVHWYLRGDGATAKSLLESAVGWQAKHAGAGLVMLLSESSWTKRNFPQEFRDLSYRAIQKDKRMIEGYAAYNKAVSEAAAIKQSLLKM